MIKVALKKAIIWIEGVDIEVEASIEEMDRLMEVYEFLEKGNSVPMKINFKERRMWGADRTFEVTSVLKDTHRC